MSARPVGAWFLAAAGIAVAGAVVAAIAIIGPPAQQRARRFDERRVSELTRIAYAVETYARTEKHLPARLDDLASTSGANAVRRTDPVTGQAYGYRVVDAGHYMLCADFAMAQARDAAAGPYVDEEWLHPAGHQCFRRAAATSDAAVRDAAEAAVDAAAAAADAMR